MIRRVFLDIDTHYDFMDPRGKLYLPGFPGGTQAEKRAIFSIYPASLLTFSLCRFMIVEKRKNGLFRGRIPAENNSE